MARKIVKPSTKKKAQPIVVRTFQEERDERMGLRLLPVDERYLKDLGDELIAWAKDRSQKNRVSLEHFYEEKDICERAFRRWCEKNPYLAECRRHAKLIMGNRLEEGLIHKTMSEKGVMYQMHHYKERWDKLNKYHAELNDKSEALSTLFKGTPFEIDSLKRD